MFWCSLLEDVRISSRALRTLISRASFADLVERTPAVRTPISDVRGPVVESVGRVQTSVTPELVARMVELYEAGASARDVGREVGLHRAAVMRHLRKAGARLRRLGLDDAQVARARDLYLSGQTLAEVGAALGAAPGTVGRYLRPHGVELRPTLFPSASSSVKE